MRDVHTVRTPENVSIELELAGMSARALAVVIDVFVMVTLIGLLALTCAVFGVVLAGFARALYFVVLFAIQWGYAVVLEWRWQGQTVGKRVVGIRVLASNGLAISFGQAALRNLLRIVDILPGGYLLGGALTMLDARARRLGDIAADTIVVRTQRATRLAEILGAEEQGGPAAADAASTLALRALSARERDVLAQLVARREQLPLPVRYALFGKLAHHFEQRMGLRRPERVSSERFVLKLAASTLPQRAKPLADTKPSNTPPPIDA